LAPLKTLKVIHRKTMRNPFKTRPALNPTNPQYYNVIEPEFQPGKWKIFERKEDAKRLQKTPE